MFTFNKLILWLSVMAPLILSPGPANLSVAGLASKRSIRACIPFISGITTINLSFLMILGFVFGGLQQSATLIFNAIELLGSLYICYLGCLFVFPPEKKPGKAEDDEGLGFVNGLMIQSLNGKLYPTVIMMFSIFLESPAHMARDVITLSILLTSLALFSYFMWALIGASIHKSLDDKKLEFLQRFVFGGLLLATGAWFVIESLIYWKGVLFV